MTKGAREYIARLKSKNEKGNFFNYTIMGFYRIFHAQVKRHGFDFRFNDFRKTAISRELSKANDNSLLAENILGFSSVCKFDELHDGTRLRSTDAKQGVLRTFGHHNPDITNKHYFGPIMDGVNNVKRLN